MAAGGGGGGSGGYGAGAWGGGSPSSNIAGGYASGREGGGNLPALDWLEMYRQGWGTDNEGHTVPWQYSAEASRGIPAGVRFEDMAAARPGDYAAYGIPGSNLNDAIWTGGEYVMPPNWNGRGIDPEVVQSLARGRASPAYSRGGGGGYGRGQAMSGGGAPTRNLTSQEEQELGIAANSRGGGYVMPVSGGGGRNLSSQEEQMLGIAANSQNPQAMGALAAGPWNGMRWRG